jgi:phosphate transport system substrate-binding protein
MLLSLLLACSGGETTPPKAEAPKPPPPAAKTEIVVKGSDSEVNLVQKLGEDFMKTHAEASLSVTGGGSGTGIAALLDGTCTLANSSRDLKGEEKLKFQEKGKEPKAFVFATDAVAVVVAKDNAVNELSLEQVGKIFRGEIKSWKAVGGPDKPISLYGRQANSGTYDYFKANATKGDFSPEVKEMNGNAQIVEGIAADAMGIGYTAAGYVKDKPGIKALSLVVDGAGVSPLDKAAVLSGRYPLARPLFQFLVGKPEGALKAFLQYEASGAGQKIVEDMGFYPIFDNKKPDNAALLGG